MKECPNECRLNGKSLENCIQYYIEISIEILRSNMEKMKVGTHKLCKQSIQGRNPQASHTKTLSQLKT